MADVEIPRRFVCILRISSGKSNNWLMNYFTQPLQNHRPQVPFPQQMEAAADSNVMAIVIDQSLIKALLLKLPI